ncbi:MAG: hypothetical protein ABIF18_01015 [archaeon]
MVRSIMIVEMAGRPAEHLTEALEKHIGILNDVKDITVHSIKVSEPREIELPEGENKISPNEKMWTAFAEADFECESFARLSETMFDFMPSSIEVIEPSKITLGMTEITDLLNNISGRMHRYDEIAKILGEKYKHMEAQLQMAKKILMARDAEIVELKKGGKKVVKKTKKNKK